MKLKVYYYETFSTPVYDYIPPKPILAAFTIPGFLYTEGESIKDVQYRLRRQWREEMTQYKKEKELVKDLFDERAHLYKDCNLDLHKSFEMDT